MSGNGKTRKGGGTKKKQMLTLNFETMTWIALAVLSLSLIKTTRQGGLILAVGYVVNLILSGVSGENGYYLASAVMNLAIGCALQYEYKWAAICSYFLVFTDAVGYIVWAKYYSHDLYDTVSVMIMIIQLMFIAMRILTHGRNRYHIKYPPNIRGSFDGRKACVTMCKTTQSEETKCTTK